MADHDVVAQLYLEGSTGTEIADVLKISYGLVYKILRAKNIPCRTRKRRAKPIKIHRDRVVDRILRFLGEHPSSTVGEITEGIGYDHQPTVGQILSRLKVQSAVIVSARPADRKEPYRWSLPAEDDGAV
jgi:transposase